eukprot:827849-Prymnesium_polylepis.1
MAVASGEGSFLISSTSSEHFDAKTVDLILKRRSSGLKKWPLLGVKTLKCLAGPEPAVGIECGWVERGDGVEELDADALVEADQVERKNFAKAPVVVLTAIVGVYGDRSRRGEELGHKTDGFHAHVRMCADDV